MALLRQVASPAAKAEWTEHLYERSYKIKNGEVEVTNQNHIDLLLGRGFAIVGEDDQPSRTLGVIRVEGEPVPQGTQTVTAEDDTSGEDEKTSAEKSVPEEVAEPAKQETPAPAKRPRGRPKKNSS